MGIATTYPSITVIAPADSESCGCVQTEVAKEASDEIEVASDSSETTEEPLFANELDTSESSESERTISELSEAECDETAETAKASEQAPFAAPALNGLLAELVDLKIKQYEQETKVEAAPSHQGNPTMDATNSSLNLDGATSLPSRRSKKK